MNEQVPSPATTDDAPTGGEPFHGPTPATQARTTSAIHLFVTATSSQE